MNIPQDCDLTYIVGYEAWYADANRAHESNPYLNIQAAAREGGVAWEFKAAEYDLDGPTLQLAMFGDSFDAFAEMPEFFAALAEQKPRTLVELRKLLDGIGARDATERTRD